MCRYFEEYPHEIPNPANSRSIGLCTGLLSAAAVSSARSLSEIIPVAVEAVKLSFRAGAAVGTARDTLDISSKNADSWSTIVTNTPEETARSALDQFHKATGIPESRKAYISAVSVMACTISGPPSTTRRLWQESEVLGKAHRVPITVYAPYHAPHLYSEDDAKNILDEHSRKLLGQFKPVGLIHSAATGKCHSHPDTVTLFECLLSEILREPVRWDLLLEETVSQVTELENTDCNIKSFGVTNLANSLVSALKSGGHQSISVRDQTAWSDTAEYAGHTQNDKIAIVGLSGRFPNSANHEELWELLMDGIDAHKEIPPDRFDAKAHCDPSGKGRNKTHTPYGCFIDEPGLFDPRFFNMSPREAAQTDPMGRLALVTAYEALEMSGYVPNRTPSTKLHRIGTFYGQTSDDWREINAAENVDTYFITGGVRAFAPGRINYYFKFSGPSFSVDTACSSSLAAIQLACTSLWAGDCDTACAGGLNVLTNPDIFSGLSKGQFLSKTGSCKTYDNDADGYCRGDGCGTVVLKRYEDAVADKDNILGSILSAGTNHSAEAVSITHPHAGAQEFLYKKVLRDAGCDPHDVSYVEMHGTGTQAGDAIEMTSVSNTFAPPHRRRRPDQPVHLGAIKANIGHGEASSGMSSLVKILMMMQKNAIPPNVGIKNVMNKTFPTDLKERNVHIPQQAVSFPRNGADKRKIFLNNFSAAGGNTAMLLEDGPVRTTELEKDPRSTHLITVSARAISSLKKNINNLIDYLGKNQDTSLTSLAYSTTARHIQHNYRVSFTVSEMSKVKDSLSAQIKDSYSPVPVQPTEAAFAFTGQGSQYTGLGQVLYETSKSFKKDIDELDHLARVQDLPSFLPMVSGTDVTTLSPVVVQLGMSCIQVALARMWQSWGLKPTAVIGHSLGEYAALHIAGVVSSHDMVRLVGRRAELLVSNCTEFSHGMLAVKSGEETISQTLGDKMTEIACKNGPEETVLCGSLDDMNVANETLNSKGIKSTMLKVPFAFHSGQVEPILEPFKEVASTVVFNKPTIPVLSPLTGGVVEDADVIGPEYLANHARKTVDFWTALTTAQNESLISEKTAWVEVGAHPVCSGMVKNSVGASVTTAPSQRRGEDAWKTIANSLSTLYDVGVYINFDEYHREFNGAQEQLTLPTYAFDNKNYWLDYHNNWCLTKGQDMVESAPSSPTISSSYSTTSCQRLVREEIKDKKGTVVFQSDLADEKLAIAVQGHLVNDNPLCPSSLYADQALTAADYVYKQLKPDAPQIGLNVCKMEVPKPLIAKVPPPKEGQHIQIEVNANLDEKEAVVKYRSVTPEGKTLQDHAHCIVKYEEIDSWYETWNSTNYMVKTQIDLLRQKLASGTAHKVLRSMAYKLFKGFVNYSPPFRGMEEVIFDGNEVEATASIDFQADESHGNYVCAPFWIDSLCHLSGFVLNGTDFVDNDQTLYISHGWGSMRFAKPFSAGKKYRSYVRMQPQPDKVRAGDVYIFEGDDLVGVVGGLKFQELPRRIMNSMLPPPKAAGASAPAKPQAQGGQSKPAASSGASKQQDKPQKPSKPAAKSPGSGVLPKVMKILAEETDVDEAELVDEAAFENLGVDSLLSLTISAKLREELEMDIPSNLFTDNENVGQLKKYFSSLDGGSGPSEEAGDDGSDSSGSSSAGDASTAPSSPPSTGEESDDKAESGSSDGGPSVARQVIGEEMGVDVAELVDKADLADMGMDSLMSLTVLSALRERSGQELPSDFLTNNTTVEAVESAMGMRPKPKQASKPSKPKAETEKKEPPLDEVNEKLKPQEKEQAKKEEQPKKEQPKGKDMSGYPNASSILIQGSAKSATKKLFLFPDGSGSATSYISIPNLGQDVAIYGMNCPFMKNPKDFDVGIDGAATLYIREMKRRQPEGPYYIGGWSAGGVLAYEIACQLQADGEEIAKIILLDSPCPINLEPLPARLHEFFDEIGLLGTGGTGSSPDWLLPHFDASIKALDEYKPQPMENGKAPKVFAVWAREGVCGKPGDPRPPPGEGEDPAPMKWLLNNRTDFGDNGWAKLLGEGKMTFAQIDGNHFTMMGEEKVSFALDHFHIQAAC